jgi:hypothetical protein
LVTRFTLEEEFDHLVFVLQNVTDLRWSRDLERLDAALAEATAQVRVPVSLLSSFVQQIGELVQAPEVRELTDKAMRQLGRIELTYDRVIASYEARSIPTRKKVPFDLKLALDHILSELPGLDRDAIKLRIQAPAAVRVDPYPVVFVLNSMVAYLLRSRSSTDPIEIELRKRDSAIEIAMAGSVQPNLTVGALAEVVEATRAEIALGKAALERIATEAGGSFDITSPVDGRERLTLRIPALAGGGKVP